MAYYHEISECVVNGEVDNVRGYVARALEEGDDPHSIIDNGLLAGMNHVGKLYESGDMFIPEVLWSAQTVNEAMAILEPLLVGSSERSPARAKVLMGTVKGDEHSIGKQLVSVILRSSGFEVADLGVDVSQEEFLAAIVECQPDVVGLSALLTTTMAAMRDTVAFLSAEKNRDMYKILVGGALVTSQFADEIGADAYAPDAGSAVDIVNELVSVR